ncbi:hypothetical protein JXI42_12870 [bacterium]|nr:hypothetical protein [bacterium]
MMKRIMKLRALSSAVIRILFSKKRYSTGRENNPERYYRNYFVEKKLCSAIDFVAEVECIHKIDAVDLLLRLGFRKWIADKAYHEWIRTILARARNHPITRSRYIVKLIAFAKKHGMDARKFF